MSDEIKPALDKREWIAARKGEREAMISQLLLGQAMYPGGRPNRSASEAYHAIMALANEALPTGDLRKFTREDLAILHEAFDAVDHPPLLSLSRRIAALLPPDAT